MSPRNSLSKLDAGNSSRSLVYERAYVNSILFKVETPEQELISLYQFWGFFLVLLSK